MILTMNTDYFTPHAPGMVFLTEIHYVYCEVGDKILFLVNDQRDAQILFYVFISIYN